MRSAAIVFLAGFVIRVMFIQFYPQVFGGDSVLRIMNRDHVLLSYQLPLLQSIVYAVSKGGGNLTAIRYAMALIGAFAGVSFFLLMRHFVDERKALWAALLFATNPFLMQLSIVPYQEVLMLGLVLLAFHFYCARNSAGASISLGLACLTRYEAWAACPVLAIVQMRRDGRSVRRCYCTVGLRLPGFCSMSDCPRKARLSRSHHVRSSGSSAMFTLHGSC
jgi:Gpi18-like mannosyltransferase